MTHSSKTRIAGTVSAALLATVAFGVPNAAAAQDGPVNLTIGSFQQGSSWYVYAVNLVELLQDALPEGSTVDAPPIAGGVGNPLLVSEGRAQLAFGMAVVGNWAAAGEIAYEEPLDDLRALIGGWDQYYLVPISRGAGNETDFETYFEKNPEADITLLRRGAIGSVGAQQMLDFAGAGEEALAASGGSYEFGSHEMARGRYASNSSDVFIHVATRGHPSITEMTVSTPTTFLQPSDALLEHMQEDFGWEPAIMPAGTFPGQDVDMKLPGTKTTLFASTAMSDDLAYTIVSTVCENVERMRAAHEALSEFSCENEVWTEANNGLPLHPGAERYYREKGYID